MLGTPPFEIKVDIGWSGGKILEMIMQLDTLVYSERGEDFLD